MEFFSTNDVNDELVCAFCKNKLDTPKVIPCGEIICTSCELEYFKSSKRKHCDLCQDAHDMPQNGFPVNTLIQKLLQKKPTRVYRGELHEEAMKAVNQIGALNRMYGVDESSYVKLMLIEHCELLRNNVDIKTESAINDIQKHRERFLKEINEYQETCLSKCENLDEFKSFIAQSKENYANWSKYLNRADITDAEIECVLKESAQLIKRFKSNQKKLDANIYGEQKLQFLANEKVLSADVIGKWKSASFSNLLENEPQFEVNYKNDTGVFEIHQDPILVDNDGQRVCVAHSFNGNDDDDDDDDDDDVRGYLKLKLFSIDGSLLKVVTIETAESDFMTFGAVKFKDSYIIQVTLPDETNAIQVYNNNLELIRTIHVEFDNSKVYTDNNKVYFYSPALEGGFWYVYDENLNRLEAIETGNRDRYPFIPKDYCEIELKYGRIFIYSKRELTIVDNVTRTVIKKLELDKKYKNDYNIIMHPVSSDSFIMIDKKRTHAQVFDFDLQCLKELTIKSIDEVSSISFTSDDSIGIFKRDNVYLF